MRAEGIISGSLRRNPAVKATLSAWRRLSGGARVPDSDRRTLVACSGGADSAALAIAIACAGVRPIVGHVLHDMRPRAEAAADRDAVRELSARLGLECVESEVRVPRQSGNEENEARRLRYAALVDLASRHACPFVAVGHHADDQLETVIMRLLRGSSARGLAGMGETRRLSRGITLVRPMLDLTRAECEGVCTAAGYEFRVDATNADTTRLRSAVRHLVTPVLRSIRPDAARRAATAARLTREASDVVRMAAEGLFAHAIIEAGAMNWSRSALREPSAIVAAEALRLACVRVANGAGGDRLSERQLRSAVRCIRSEDTEPKVFCWSRACVHVTSRRVTVAEVADGR